MVWIHSNFTNLERSQPSFKPYFWEKATVGQINSMLCKNLKLFRPDFNEKFIAGNI
tara:strand:- start:127 stop:294 length:168 start_codon:yes stop_codon:yes gene_type:complete